MSQALKPTRKRFHALQYCPRVRGFHIVVQLKDMPGALNSVLDLLRQQVDLTNTISYNTSEGRAISSIFAKAISRSVTENSLKSVIAKSPFVEDYEVVGSKGGLVADTFHEGIELGPGESLVAISVGGLSHMFRSLINLFGTGGEVILFEEGLAVGRENGDYLKKFLGASFVRNRLEDLAALYAALGWGRATVVVEKRGKMISAKVEDCFECSGVKERSQNCQFFRGHLVGIVSSFLGGNFRGEERKCRLKGDPHCEFYIERVGRD